MTADQWRAAGERIEALLDGLSVEGTVARERAEQLVREVADLYGAALARVTALADDAGLQRLTGDDLIASLLLVHGLHPHGIDRRVADALDRVRPYLGSHGGDIELLEVVPGRGTDVTVRLRFAGSCKSCPSSAATLELAVEDAVRAAAPEVTAIEVVTADADAAVIPPDALLGHLHRTAWQPVPDLAGLGPGEVGGFRIDDGHRTVDVLACRVGDELFAYRDRCPSCDGSLAGAALHRMPASRDPVLRCPRCHAHYDVVHAGARLDAPDQHLEPLPLLTRDGVLAMAVPAQPAGLPA